MPRWFGLRAAGWLVTVLDARRLLARVEPAAQLGGAAGTLAALGSEGPEVLRLFALDHDGLVFSIRVGRRRSRTCVKCCPRCLDCLAFRGLDDQVLVVEDLA